MNDKAQIRPTSKYLNKTKKFNKTRRNTNEMKTLENLRKCQAKPATTNQAKVLKVNRQYRQRQTDIQADKQSRKYINQIDTKSNISKICK